MAFSVFLSTTLGENSDETVVRVVGSGPRKQATKAVPNGSSKFSVWPCAVGVGGGESMI